MGNALRPSRARRSRKLKGATMVPLAQMPIQRLPKTPKANLASRRRQSTSSSSSTQRSVTLSTPRSGTSSSSVSSKRRSNKFLQTLLKKRKKANWNKKKAGKTAVLDRKRNESAKWNQNDDDNSSSHSSASSKSTSAQHLLDANVSGPSEGKSEVATVGKVSGMGNTVDENRKREVERWVDRMLDKGIDGLLKEFAQLKSDTNPSADLYQHFTDNQAFGRNRYKAVCCLDGSRIVLRDHPTGNDYIHANYVGTPSMPNRFICTQAPNERTIYDFWLMVVQERVETIVMLGDFVEKGKPKCSVYFPRTEGAVFSANDFRIRCESVTRLPEFQNSMIRRLLSITGRGTPMKVTHYHWSNWPDHTVPSANRAPLRLFQMVNSTKRPICVHCSAGIGRTGSVVTIAYLVEALAHGRVADLADILKRLRQQRAGIVQTDMQYLYIHRILLIYLADKKLIKPSARLNDFVQRYDKLVSPV